MVPPRLDLEPYRRVGLVQFTVERAKRSLHELATERFAEELLAARRVEVPELGVRDSLVRRVGETQFGPASAQALGAERAVPAVLAGHLVVPDVKPSDGLIGLRAPFVEAPVSVERTISERRGTGSRPPRLTGPPAVAPLSLGPHGLHRAFRSAP